MGPQVPGTGSERLVAPGTYACVVGQLQPTRKTSFWHRQLSSSKVSGLVSKVLRGVGSARILSFGEPPGGEGI